jgi:hypothetical protein
VVLSLNIADHIFAAAVKDCCSWRLVPAIKVKSKFRALAALLVASKTAAAEYFKFFMIFLTLSTWLRNKAHREVEWVDFDGKVVNVRVKADVFRLFQN